MSKRLKSIEQLVPPSIHEQQRIDQTLSTTAQCQTAVEKDRIDVEPQFGGDFDGRVAVDGEPPEGFPGIRLEIGLHDCQQLLEDVPVVVQVPLARERAVGIGELIEKAVSQVQPRHGLASDLLPKCPDFVDGHLPEPGAE
ncbi:MAG: hypothetical protein ACXVB2_01670 [Isosphaeraceae bacterium]